MAIPFYAKNYQKEAVANALEIFRYAEKQLKFAETETDKTNITAHNGCILLEAPTGSGKTRMAGMIAEDFSRVQMRMDNAKVVWFWFTPFKGLVEQTASALRRDFHSLRIRNLQNERRTGDIASGDMFVTTWASVATSNKDSRRLRKDGDIGLGLDNFIPALRTLGFRIGVVVDEAHHGFTKAKEAVSLYLNVLQPDFTLLTTATPDDSDVEKFKDAVGIAEVYRIRVSRKDAVDAGLIKDGIKSVAYLAPAEQQHLVDFALTALGDAWQIHNAIKAQLADNGINLVPLMLVQVGNSDKAVEVARGQLARLGVPEEAIAWYTADDPNDDLLTVAIDERKEVLIFKVAVALGFDAPRAFTLVSMRGAQDTNFGIQVVGRILRTHALLQAPAMARKLPELLRFGYAFLADAENQTGLTSAGEKINTIQTELSNICPFAMVVQVAGENRVQVVYDGQPSLLPQETVAPAWQYRGENDTSTTPITPANNPLLSGFILPELTLEGQTTGEEGVKTVSNVLVGFQRFMLREGVQNRFETEEVPLATNELVACIAASFPMDERVLATAFRRNVTIQRRQIEIFQGNEQLEKIQAKLSDVDIAKRGQSVLFDAHHIDPRDLFKALLGRMEREYEQRGYDKAETELHRSLFLILATFPSLVRKTIKQCLAKYRKVVPAQKLPEYIEAIAGVKKSRLNGYGIMPQDLNNPERQFAEMLDADMSGTVEWWLRNEQQKAHSIGIVMPNGYRYYPDFIVKVQGRKRGGGILLVEIKGNHILNGDDTLDKVIAEHKNYGAPLMLLHEQDSKRFMTVRHNERTDKNQADQIFRVENMPEY